MGSNYSDLRDFPLDRAGGSEDDDSVELCFRFDFCGRISIDNEMEVNKPSRIVESRSAGLSEFFCLPDFFERFS